MAEKKSRSRAVWVAVAVLVVVLAAVGTGWLLGAGARDGEPEPGAQGQSGGASAEAGGGSDSACGLPDGSQAVPAEGPEAEWETLQGHTVPVSKKFGPGQLEGEDRSCFAHSPTGALFAALNIGRVLPKDLVLKHMTKGGLRDALKEAPEASVDPKSRTVVRGFKLDVESKNAVVVRPVYSTDGGALHEIPARMVWKSGDWMMDGNYMSQPRDVNSLEGYAEWGPE